MNSNRHKKLFLVILISVFIILFGMKNLAKYDNKVNTENWKIYIRHDSTARTVIDKNKLSIQDPYGKGTSHRCSFSDSVDYEGCSYDSISIFEDGYIALKTAYTNKGNFHSLAELSIVLLDNNFEKIESLYSVGTIIIPPFPTSLLSKQRDKISIFYYKGRNDLDKTAHRLIYDIKNRKLLYHKPGFVSNEILALMEESVCDSSGKNIRIYKLNQNEMILEQKGAYGCLFLNDNVLIYQRKGKIFEYDLSTNKEKKIFSFFLSSITNYWFSPDRKYILIENSGIPSYHFYNYSNGKAIKVPFEIYGISEVDWMQK